jgi:phasin family protein
MADQTNTEAAAEAPAKVAEAVAETVSKVVAATAKTAKAERVKTVRRAKRRAAAPAVTAAVAPKAATRRPKPRRTARKARTVASERIKTVEFNANRFFAGFDSLPVAEPLKAFFTQASERSQEAVKRSQKVAEELADIARGNVEAFVESSRLASEGARTIGQDVVAKGRANVEQAADAVRSLAEAKSPTEFFQLQSELAKSSFDRLVAESSKFTESFVKLAGEAIQPLSNRATANAERLNDLVA